MQCKRTGDNEHHRPLYVKEGHVADKLSLDDNADIGKACQEVMHRTDDGAHGDGDADIAVVFLDFAQ